MSFFRTLIYFFLGDFGRAALDFYATYAVWINAIALVYGIVLIYAHENLRRFIRRIEATIVSYAHTFDGPQRYAQIRKKLIEDWAETQADQSLWIPHRTDLWIERIKKRALLDLLHIEPEYIKLVLHTMTGEPKRTEFSIGRYRVWSEYRHRMLTGIRSRIKHPEAMLEKFDSKERPKGRKRR
jgi:hypothetical protein